jgi:hydroxyethylthiazole kinase-like uncharacterized protein yjeF
MTARPILTAEAMRTSEQAAIETGTPIETLMDRAGAALAEAAYQFAGPLPMLILCGPGNNGGDGFVAARYLAAGGVNVRVSVLAEPASAAAKWARSQWTGPVETLNSGTASAAVVIDALFGTGLKRAVQPAVTEVLSILCRSAVVRIACDLPSGIASDSGECLSPTPFFDLTVTFGALKPAHRLYPAMDYCGRVILSPIGLNATDTWHEIAPPELPRVAQGLHKYTRGLVHALAGKMPGAMSLAAAAAARSGAGYVRVSTSKAIEGLPAAVVQSDSVDVNDQRIGCLLVGPGMGDIPPVLTLALTSRAPKVIDADGLTHLGEPERLRGQDAVITPHEGEFRTLFGDLGGTKADRALEAARRCGAVVVYKGADTLVASPDGRLGFRPPAPAYLASAGTGDVLSGIIAALRARQMDAFDASCAAVWIHARAAELAGAQMIADDLVRKIPQVIGSLR